MAASRNKFRLRCVPRDFRSRPWYRARAHARRRTTQSRHWPRSGHTALARFPPDGTFGWQRVHPKVPLGGNASPPWTPSSGAPGRPARTTTRQTAEYPTYRRKTGTYSWTRPIRRKQLMIKEHGRARGGDGDQVVGLRARLRAVKPGHRGYGQCSGGPPVWHPHENRNKCKRPTRP
jgi:hypothetical protein